MQNLKHLLALFFTLVLLTTGCSSDTTEPTTTGKVDNLPGNTDNSYTGDRTTTGDEGMLSSNAGNGNRRVKIIVDHTNWDWYNSQPQQVFDRVAAQRIYFAHASVGSNILAGLKALHSTNLSKYPIGQTNAGASPPSQTTKGVIYEYSRGNPGWSAKVLDFETYVANGWHDPKVDILINKFCYIDQEADLKTYVNSMTALEAKYAGTKFIYFTMPLSTQKGLSGALRGQFNANLRNWIATQDNKILFDLADIESTSPDRVRQTFNYNNVVYENLFPLYTEDGGHLNNTGSQRAATGLYSIFGQIAALEMLP